MERALETGAAFDAFAETGLIAWPEGEMGDPRHARYEAIEDEVLAATIAAILPTVVDAFATAAREIIGRERRRR